MERVETDVVFLGPDDYRTLGEADFGVPGLRAHEVIGPFVRVRALGPLIMVHDGHFEPRHGIGHHPHRFNERLFYILEGAVDHDDALNGITGHMDAGDMGRLTEGARGMLHKEWNNTDGPGRAFILVYETEPVPPAASFELLPDADAARYEEAPGVATKELVGPRVRFPTHGDIRLFADSTLQPGSELRVETEPGTSGMAFVLEGTVEVEDGRTLSPGGSVLVAPGAIPRTLVLRATGPGRLLRVIAGPGHGLVTR